MYDLEDATNIPHRRKEPQPVSVAGLLGALWGIAGFSFFLGYAILRLLPVALETFAYSLRWYHWAALGINLIMMAYLEGYRGFQKGFSPRMAARAKYLAYYPELLPVLLAPFYCVGYFRISKKRQRAVIWLTIAIICFIFLIRFLDQPWRGIADAGVVVGLTWGLISLLIFTFRAFTPAGLDVSPEVPDTNRTNH